MPDVPRFVNQAYRCTYVGESYVGAGKEVGEVRVLCCANFSHPHPTTSELRNKPPITIGENAQTRRLFLMLARPETKSLELEEARRPGIG